MSLQLSAQQGGRLGSPLKGNPCWDHLQGLLLGQCFPQNTHSLLSSSPPLAYPGQEKHLQDLLVAGSSFPPQWAMEEERQDKQTLRERTPGLAATAGTIGL